MAKGNPLLSVRIPPDLAELLDQKAAEMGSDRSKVTIIALESLLKPPNPQDELSAVKQQIASLAAAMQSIQKNLG
ncbi:MAG: ribbon-helix-helix domain-containing protein [Kovacikia sp.]